MLSSELYAFSLLGVILNYLGVSNFARTLEEEREQRRDFFSKEWEECNEVDSYININSYIDSGILMMIIY